MPLFGTWKWYHLAAAAVLVAAATWWLGGSLSQLRPESEQRADQARPATIDMAVLRIESNVMRIQSIMVEVVFSDYSKAMEDNIKAMDRMDQAARHDLASMASDFADGNPQLAKASDMFNEWKAIRDEAISLSLKGNSQQAQKIVREQSEAQVWKIRSALDSLSQFSQKRSDDYNQAQSDQTGRQDR